jgi:AcrR family transcriptional regulator
MPRQPDPGLEDRILKAAQRLWKKGGEGALTMRAVAQAANTNTPAVYRRFRNRQDILRALLRRSQQDLGRALQPRRSVEEMAEAYLDYALSHPHEYELFYKHLHQLSASTRTGRVPSLKESRPNLALMEVKLAEQLGGTPEDHRRLGIALWATAHGAAMLLLSRVAPGEYEPEVRRAFTLGVEALLREASSFSVRK